jgi:hypothetical protein
LAVDIQRPVGGLTLERASGAERGGSKQIHPHVVSGQVETIWKASLVEHNGVSGSGQHFTRKTDFYRGVAPDDGDSVS